MKIECERGRERVQGFGLVATSRFHVEGKTAAKITEAQSSDFLPVSGRNSEKAFFMLRLGRIVYFHSSSLTSYLSMLCISGIVLRSATWMLKM